MQRLVLLVSVGWIACGTAPPPPPPRPMSVPVVTLAEAELVDSTEYLAQLRSRAAPAIRPQVDGQITRISSCARAPRRRSGRRSMARSRGSS